MYIFLSEIKLQMWGMLVGDVGWWGEGSTCDSWGWLGGKRVVSVLSPGCSGVYIIYTWQMGSSYTLTLCQGRGFDIVLLLFSH